MALQINESRSGRRFALVVAVLAAVVTTLAMAQDPARSAGAEDPIDVDARIVVADRELIGNLVQSLAKNSSTPKPPTVYASGAGGAAKQPRLSALILPKDADARGDDLIEAGEKGGTMKVTRLRRTTHADDTATFAFDAQVPVMIDKPNVDRVVFLKHSYRLRVTPEIVEAGAIRLKVSLENTFPDSAALETLTQVSAVVPDNGVVVIRGIGNTSLPDTSELQLWITPRVSRTQTETPPNRRASR